MTVAFEIKWPWFWMRYRPPIVTIWHVDPETDGSDDSCGWAFPRLTKHQKSMCGHCGYCEAQTPWFQRDPVKRISSPADAEALMRGLILGVARMLRVKLSWNEVCKMACDLTHNCHDNFQGSLCHLPGWHTNFEEDRHDERELRATGLFSNVARVILQKKRPWYRHPRWHVWHWKIQIHPFANFKRWMFSRCCKCGKGFRWGEAPCTANWNSKGPQWFKSEADIYHTSCSGSQVIDTVEKNK